MLSPELFVTEYSSFFFLNFSSSSILVLINSHFSCVSKGCCGPEWQHWLHISFSSLISCLLLQFSIYRPRSYLQLTLFLFCVCLLLLFLGVLGWLVVGFFGGGGGGVGGEAGGPRGSIFYALFLVCNQVHTPAH